MKILMVASEAIPYLRTSDVATVVTNLSTALREKGHDVRIVIPFYSRNVSIDPALPLREIAKFDVKLGVYTQQASVQFLSFKETPYRPPLYLIHNDFYFGRDNPYGYLDDYERFIFFSRAAIGMLANKDFLAESWRPELIHGHDWAVGLLPMCLRHTYAQLFSTEPIPFVYTVHNAGFPGQFGYRALKVAELEDLGIYESLGETPNTINFLARGILAADAVNTVSPRHAKEIESAEQFPELARALKLSHKTITGILNGLDYSSYNPAFDETIRCKFNQDTLEKRRENKQALQEEYGLRVGSDVPLIGMISRLIPDKGIRLVEEIIPELMHDDVQIVIVGIVGDHSSHEAFARYSREYPESFVHIFSTLDDPIAHRVLAGADIVLVPSLREPCGSQQMAAMRYGAIPVVRCTGGLADTVTSWKSETKPNTGKGFLFNEPTSENLLQVIRDALHLYRSDHEAWQSLQLHNMGVRFPWRDAAQKYVKLYHKAIETGEVRRPLEGGKSPVLDQSDLLVNALLESGELSTTIIDQEQYLVQVARNIRELLKSDAVLIWKFDDRDPRQLTPLGRSFKRREGEPLMQFDPFAYREYPRQESRGWHYIFQLKTGGDSLPPADVGFLSSQLARQRAWVAQLSVPMNARGVMLGKIDVFSCDLQPPFAASIDMLRAFASAVAITLETARASEEAKSLLEADRKMARAQLVAEIADVVLQYAKDLTHADAAYLSLTTNHSYFLDNNAHTALALTDGIPDSATTTALHLRMEYRSQVSSEIAVETGEIIGTITVFKSLSAPFSKEEESVLHSLGKQSANALLSAYLREQEDQNLIGKLSKLTRSLAGETDIDTLSRNVISTISDVLHARHAFLYILDENSQRLVLRATSSYSEPLSTQTPEFYNFGKGIIGWIAETGEALKANSLEELQAIPQWTEEQQAGWNGQESGAFLGIPLKAIGRINQRERVIGVIKLAGRTSQKPFTDQDLLIAEIMANLIATVIQNRLQSNARLLELNTNLQTLSAAMMGGLEMSALVQRIVDTIAEVVGADAASLYLIEPGTDILTIRAATGYQSGLVTRGASYTVQGEGLTAWIAREGQSFKADNVDELRKHPNWADKYKEQQPNAFLGIPLKAITQQGREEVIGVLKVQDVRPSPHHPESYFTQQDTILVEMMGNVITTVIQNTRLSNARLQELSTNLRTLSQAMVGGLEMPALMQRIVDTIAEVIGADAASLYLIEPDTQILAIQAATGYQKGLMARDTRYSLRDEAITAWIARTGRPFVARTVSELKNHPEWTGRYNPFQEGRVPNSFLGLPLKGIAEDGTEEIIGVLKIEDVRPGPRHPEPYFTEQDTILVEMMGNVIATTVIQNTRLSNARLQELSTNLQTLSAAMMGGLEMSALVQRIVDKIATVVGADAASLYLIEPGTDKLTIQAATGYQSGLVARGASYTVQGKGITAWIAREGKAFKADNVEELRMHQYWADKYKEKKPNAFLGIPLKAITQGGREEVIGVLKVQDVRRSPHHPESYFTEQDRILVEMMGNVITTVIQNTRLNSKSAEELLSYVFDKLGSFKQEPYKVLHPFVSHQNEALLNAISQPLLSLLPPEDQPHQEQIQALLDQSQELLSMGANRELISILAKRSKAEVVSRWYENFYHLYKNPGTDIQKITRVLLLGEIWHSTIDVVKRTSREKLLDTTGTLAREIAQATGGKTRLIEDIGQWITYEMLEVFTNSSVRIPESLYMVFFMGSEWREKEDMAYFRLLLPHLQKGRFSIIAVVSSLQEEDQAKCAANLRRELELDAIDFISLTVQDIMSIIAAKDPLDLLLSQLLKGINLLRISPYKITGPTTDDMFFGREREIREITDQASSTSYAIIGGRRVGKSSFLFRLHLNSLPRNGFRTLYHDCTTTPTFKDFIEARLSRWQPEPEPGSHLPATFGELLQSLPIDMPLVLLLDEADKLIPGDRADHWRLFNALRSSVSLGQMQVILCGESRLLDALKEDSGPLFNFVNERRLGPLAYPDVEKLVTRPMQRMGITLEDERKIVKRIWDFTSGHPNVVQRLCHRLIVQLNADRMRFIGLNDVDGVIRNPKFQEEDFLETYMAQATPLERIIVLLMAISKGDHSYHLQDIIKLLAAHDLKPGVESIREALAQLTELRSILKRDQAGYTFAVEAFPRVLRNRVTIDDMLIELKSEYAKKSADARE